jgi:hypothetical protein
MTSSTPRSTPSAYQLIVTHRGTGPIRQPAPNEWEFSKSRFIGQKRSQTGAIAIDPVFAEIWPGPGLVNGSEAVKEFIILTDFSRCQGRPIGRVSRRPKQPHKEFP